MTASGFGVSADQPDWLAKVTGSFAYANDLGAEGMVWATTVRSPHPHARIRSVDTSGVWAVPGVLDVITHADLPGRLLHGQMKVDQPVLAIHTVRYHGEPVVVVAAESAEAARIAAGRVRVDYDVLTPLVDAEAALAAGAPLIHPDGNLLSGARIRRGAAQSGELPAADVVVRGSYALGMQDQAFLATEAGLAVPTPDGGVELHIATQWLHLDQEQVAACLDLPAEKVVLKQAGVGGAFGGREDLTVHVPACLFALRLQRPVKMAYSRQESFLGHVHRHHGWLRYEHGATAEGQLVYVRADIVLDGGAYASSSPALAGNAATHAVGPYDVPHVWVDARVAYTNNPPCGAMRGFGTVQPCFAAESQMDRLAAAVGIDPVDLRLRNALREGRAVPTGQVLDSPAPVAELLHRLRELPVPTATAPADDDTAGAHLRRGVGYAASLKNIGFSEGFDDYSTARVRLQLVGGVPRATVTTAAVDVGQGVLGVQRQIVAAELGVRDVVAECADTRFGSAGPTSASRHTYVTGGAVRDACRKVRAEVLALLHHRRPDCAEQRCELRGEAVVDEVGTPVATLADLLGEAVIEQTAEFHHRRTHRLDPATGQGDSAMQFGFAAHRAVVEVDVELGQVRVLELATAQDVGRAINPGAIIGQMQGGSVQGLGLALMEELELAGGQVVNPSFADYLIPTMADVSAVRAEILESPDPHAPYGVRGIGELPAMSATPAVVAAVRAATGWRLDRVPLRPDDLVAGPVDPQQ